MELLHIPGAWPLYTNTFLLFSGDGRAAVVDPAADAAVYEKALAEHGARLTDILLTHGHYDHVASPRRCAAAPGPRSAWTPPTPSGPSSTRSRPTSSTNPGRRRTVRSRPPACPSGSGTRPATRRAASACIRTAACSAAIRCSRAPAGAWTCPAAAWPKCRKASRSSPPCRCRTRQRSCPGTSAFPPLARSAAKTPA